MGSRLPVAACRHLLPREVPFHRPLTQSHRVAAQVSNRTIIASMSPPDRGRCGSVRQQCPLSRRSNGPVVDSNRQCQLLGLESTSSSDPKRTLAADPKPPPCGGRTPRNCLRSDLDPAVGTCYKNTFGEWHCLTMGAGVFTQAYQPP